ncbi:hypothetical protein BDC45DRAFT_5008 [Circinella umbellata]|nr:hypothetical protein BDC45DRAFT_5008 [Circinella umbellata]
MGDDEELKPDECMSQAQESELLLPQINGIIKLNNPPATPPVDASNKKQRTYNEAVISACHKEGSEQYDKNNTSYILQNLSLDPFSVLDNEGNEENALPHATVIDRLVSKHNSIRAIAPLKRPREDSPMCISCSPSINTDLKSLFATSPYSTLRKQREYMLLTDDICAEMNKDWRFYQQTGFFTAAIMAGAILLNTNNNQAIMINTLEIYGRTKSVDQHRESFGKLKSGARPNSLPPPIKKLHPDVWPVSLEHHDGLKLIIGTQVSNALVTSSIRLDEKLPLSVGGMTTHFRLDNIKDSLACKIFLDMDSVKAARVLIENPATRKITDTGLIFNQLRQVRTHFDSPSTYTLCRASGPLTKSHTCQPYSLFTLIDYDRGRNPSAGIFQIIAEQVLKHHKTAKLNKENIMKLQKEILKRILALYNNEDDSLLILFHYSLNKELEELADFLMPSIIYANASIESQVKQVFELFI